MTGDSHHSSNAVDGKPSASKFAAIGCGWFGAFAPGTIVFAVLAMLGKLKSVDIDNADAFILGIVVCFLAASILTIGIALVIAVLPQIAERHAVQFFIATAVCGACAVGFTYLLATIWNPRPRTFGLDFYTTCVCLSAVITYCILKLLLHKQILAQPRSSECPKCGYPIGTSPVCTECGTNLPLPLGEGLGEGMNKLDRRSEAPSPLTPLPKGEGNKP